MYFMFSYLYGSTFSNSWYDCVHEYFSSTLTLIWLYGRFASDDNFVLISNIILAV